MVMTKMVAHSYTYQDVLANSKKVAWTEDDVLNGRSFDLSKRFLPNSLSGVDEIDCLNEDEKRKLNQIMGNAYCHLFAFVEEFIVPTVTRGGPATILTATKCDSARSCASRRRS